MVIKIYTGSERLLIERMILKDKRMVNMPEYGYRTFNCISSEIPTFFASACFSNIKLALVTVEKIEALDNPIFKNLITGTIEDGDYLIIVANSCDKRKSIYKECEKRGLVTEYNKLTDKNILMQFLLREILSYGGRITPGAMELFIQRTGYLDDDSVTLYYLVSLLKDLVDYQRDIDTEAVLKIVPENVLNNVFSLSKLLMDGDMESIFKQLPGLQKSKDTIGILSTLLYAFRIAQKARNFSKLEIGLKYGGITFEHLSDDCLIQCIEQVTQTIADIKAGLLLEKEALSFTVIELFRIFTENGVYRK